MSGGPDLGAEVNLLLSFEEMGALLTALLPRATLAEDVLDAFLLAAGMHQIHEDYSGEATTVKGGRGAAAGGVVLGALVRQLASGVAACVVNGAEAVPLAAFDRSAAEAGIGHVMASAPRRMRREVVRLPNCYRSFDQHPADTLELARRFANGGGDRDRPVAVVGLRTSGSYLAPLTAAFLTLLGFQRTDVFTVRPGAPRPATAEGALRRLATAGAVAVVVDDPPVTGAALERAAGELRSLGWPQESIVMLVASFSDDGALPERLAAYPSVVLPWECWRVPGRLADDEVAATAAALVGVALPLDGGGRLTVKSVEAVEAIAGFRPRGHARGALSLEVSDGSGAPSRRALVGVEGCGIGYLGRHASAVASRLGPRVPAVLRADDGLLFREWLPDEARLSIRDLNSRPGTVARLVAGYVHERHRALPVAEDVSRRLKGRSAVAELVGQMLASAFGPAGRWAARPCRQAGLHLLAVAQPSVIDGKMALGNWYWSESGDLRKAGAWDRAFSNRDLCCYDPVFDVAGAAADAELHGADDFGPLLRRAYEEVSGAPVADERWLLYGLFHHVIGHQISGRVGAAADAPSPHVAPERAVRERCVTRWLARYLAAAWPAPPGGPVAGPLVAIPLEGSLESAWMGFWAPRRRSLLALPALTAHGYRPVLLSARPAVEVGDHCRAWRLAGGVAEGGGSVYDGARDREMAVEGPGGWGPALGVLERAAGAPPSAPTVTASAGESTDDLVRRLVGHAPGGCPRCAPPACRPGSGLLLEPVLDAIGASTTVRLASAGRLAWRALAATVREGAGQLGS